MDRVIYSIWVYSKRVFTFKTHSLSTILQTKIQHLNKALQDTHPHIPSVDDIMPMLTGKAIFSKLDLKTAFHLLELSEDSRILTVFCAGDRLMHYKRFAMGTLPATGELNSRLRPIITNIPNTAVIQDDIVIATTDKETHYQTLEAVITALEKAGLTVSPSKCILGQPEIPFWRFKVNKNGVKPDLNKVQAVQEAGRPTSKDELWSFLCMIRSNGTFIPDLAAATENLHELTKQNAVFKWTETHEKEFQNIKNTFTTDVLLRHYNKQKYLHLCRHQLHRSLRSPCSRPVHRTNKSCHTATAAEKIYSQLDLEATAIDFGLRQFRHILAGGPQITVVTDQQPLQLLRSALWSNKRQHGIYI